MYHTRCDSEIVAIRTAQAYNLLAANAPEQQSKELRCKTTDLLIDLSPDSTRRAILTKIKLAQAFLGLGELDYPVQFALETLPLMDQLKSTRCLLQLGKIYEKLRKGKLRDLPQVARLGLYLHEYATAL